MALGCMAVSRRFARNVCLFGRQTKGSRSLGDLGMGWRPGSGVGANLDGEPGTQGPESCFAQLQGSAGRQKFGFESSGVVLVS